MDFGILSNLFFNLLLATRFQFPWLLIGELLLQPGLLVPQLLDDPLHVAEILGAGQEISILLGNRFLMALYGLLVLYMVLCIFILKAFDIRFQCGYSLLLSNHTSLLSVLLVHVVEYIPFPLEISRLLFVLLACPATVCVAFPIASVVLL